MRNRIKNHCFRTLILKLVNPLESLEDRICEIFFLVPLVLMAWLKNSSSSLKQSNMAPPSLSHVPGGGVYLNFISNLFGL